MPTWKNLTDANPAHSHNYARRWKMLAAEGNDIYGEARLADAMVPRNSKILDAGCGTGRLSGYLAQQGHTVVGTDIDPILISYAEQDFPDITWRVGDLSVDPLVDDDFDLAISAGNVLTFVDPRGREFALANVFNALKPGGRFVTGFGAGRGWEFSDYLELAQQVGFSVDFAFSSWELGVFDENSTFLVAVLSRPGSSFIN
ncbi:MAG: class I SAM-dependent methyltransferase [Corynebacterium sp.]|nr:class I SAM-dependent methyltransferase [Corynebacterium sp.]